MPEESQLEEMRSAIRGDFARLAARRGDQELMRVGAELEEVEDDTTTAPVEPVVADEAQAPRSWFARLISP